MPVKPRTVTAETVLAAAVRITEAGGLSALTIPSLADELNLKPASLYNHIKGIDEIKSDVMRYAVGELDRATIEAAFGYAREDALLRIADASLSFAVSHPELYNALSLYSVLQTSEYKELINQRRSAAHQILDTYDLPDDVKRRFIIAFKSCLHGFVSLRSVIEAKDNMDTAAVFKKIMTHIIKMLGETDNG